MHGGSRNGDRTKSSQEHGAVDQDGAWPDYLQYSFTAANIPALLDLLQTKSLTGLAALFGAWVPLSSAIIESC